MKDMRGCQHVGFLKEAYNNKQFQLKKIWKTIFEMTYSYDTSNLAESVHMNWNDYKQR